MNQSIPQGLSHAVRRVAAHGRNGDTMLAHVSPDEVALMHHVSGGQTSINPHTGLPEYFGFGDILKLVAQAGAGIGGFVLGGPAGSAAASAAMKKALGGSWKDALLAGGLAGVGGFAGQALKGGIGSMSLLGKDTALANALGGSGSSASSGVAGAAMPAAETFGPPIAPPSIPSIAVNGAPYTEALPTGLGKIGSQLFTDALHGGPSMYAGIGSALAPTTPGPGDPVPQAAADTFRIHPPTPLARGAYRPYLNDPLLYGQAGQGGEHQYWDNVNPQYVAPSSGMADGGPVTQGNFGPTAPDLRNVMMQSIDQAAKGYARGGRVQGLAAGGQPDSGFSNMVDGQNQPTSGGLLTPASIAAATPATDPSGAANQNSTADVLAAANSALSGQQTPTPTAPAQTAPTTPEPPAAPTVPSFITDSAATRAATNAAAPKQNTALGAGSMTEKPAAMPPAAPPAPPAQYTQPQNQVSGAQNVPGYSNTDAWWNNYQKQGGAGDAATVGFNAATGAQEPTVTPPSTNGAGNSYTQPQNQVSGAQNDTGYQNTPQWWANYQQQGGQGAKDMAAFTAAGGVSGWTAPPPNPDTQPGGVGYSSAGSGASDANGNPIGQSVGGVGYSPGGGSASDAFGNPIRMANGGPVYSTAEINEARRVAQEISENTAANGSHFGRGEKVYSTGLNEDQRLAKHLWDKYGINVYSNVQEAPAMTYYQVIPPDPDIPSPYADGGSVGTIGSMHPVDFSRGGGTVNGPGDGKSDEIPAMLSNGEHVIPAADVSDLGDGSNDAGHKVLERFKQEIRRRAGRKSLKKPSKSVGTLGSIMRASGAI